MTTVLAFLGWCAAYGLIYWAICRVIERRHRERLERLKAEWSASLEQINARFYADATAKLARQRTDELTRRLPGPIVTTGPDGRLTLVWPDDNQHDVCLISREAAAHLVALANAGRGQ